MKYFKIIMSVKRNDAYCDFYDPFYESIGIKCCVNKNEANRLCDLLNDIFNKKKKSELSSIKNTKMVKYLKKHYGLFVEDQINYFNFYNEEVLSFDSE